ncbi:hypothetical protein GCM10025865_27710 [Paraoerskovia sediminicola]|uniref:Uncharacterized protein n=1 Tax=Paraoerskovia sediminicola TaxID=1138587 RepID=A0ABM8G5N8_9CELL|nr:hypothetical protein [Paraoerskovia sediminicola]BDZ43472.1 hypothetical protein GCM10025865_27710 [Paraoerskovia sediminicola]
MAPATPVSLKQRAGENLRTGTVGLVILTIFVGAFTGLGAVGFRWLIDAVTQVFSGTTDYSAVGLGNHPRTRGSPGSGRTSWSSPPWSAD